MNKFLVELPIIRSGFDTTKSAKFKGKLTFICNNNGVIYNWKISFSYLELDQFSTSAWFDKKSSNFKRRKDLFKELKIEQIPRPTRSSHKIILLDDEKIKIVENYLNDRSKYNSTIKNIIPLLKGNNPGGEAKKPSSAEMVINWNNNAKNFVILLDDLIAKHKTDFDALLISTVKIDFQKYIELNPSLKAAFNFMQKTKDYSSWITYLDNIKKYFKQYNTYLSKAQKIALRARSKYMNNIKREVKKFPFHLVSDVEFQKCHIYEFHDLRDEIVEAIQNNKPTQKFEDMISDHNNFLPLPEQIHRKFDQNYFTYKPNGTIWALNEKGNEFVQTFVEEKFKQIPQWFLNKNRIKYIKLRNQDLFY